MTYTDLLVQNEEILNAVLTHRIYDALKLMADINRNKNTVDLQNRLNSISDTYKYMLKFSFEQASDPEREKVYKNLQQSILGWTDDSKELWIRTNNIFERDKYRYRITDLKNLSDKEVDQLIVELETGTISKAEGETGSDSGENIFNDSVINLFYTVWLTNRFQESEIILFNRLMESKLVQWPVKALLISALTLSLMRHFDRSKFFIFFDLIHEEKVEIRQRSIIGLFLCLILYEKRLVLYSDILSRLESVPDDSILQERFLAVLLQFIRSRDTEKITKTIREEIVPEVMKIRSDLEEKLNLDDLLNKETLDDKNPEWKDFFKDAPDVYQKLEQFSKLQVEGSDVFMGAFAMLKHFDFFKEMANWFLPFEGSHPEIKQSFSNVSGEMDMSTFIEGLEKSTVLCNSDKYSFCLNVKHMPEQQRKMMLDLFSMELKSMNELMEDELKLNVESRNKVVDTQYLQDMYRFFKLYPYRKEFEDVFMKEANILDSVPLKILFKEKKTIQNLAEFHFARDHYEEALMLFSWLIKDKQSYEIIEKMGFCYQKLGNLEKAIEMYLQAELYDRNKIWLHKKLGYCYRKLGEFSKAIEYYEQIVKKEPKDLNNLAYLGQLYMDTGDFDQALSLYYKVEYEDSSNIKVYRPIGWCSFVLGKYDIAIRYFQKVIEKKPVKNDYLNIGHCFWVTGNMQRALDAYRKALDSSKKDIDWFRRAFQQDSEYLKKTGIDDLDISLMVDYVLVV